MVLRALFALHAIGQGGHNSRRCVFQVGVRRPGARGGHLLCIMGC